MLTSTSSKVFIGRDEILETLNKRVESLKSGYRQNVALTGQKLCGKTSILQNFLNNLKGDSVIPVYIEVLIEPLETFSKKFIGTMLLNFLKSSNEETREDLHFLISRGQALIPKTAASIKEVLHLLEKKDYQEAYSGLFNLTSTLKEETKKSCIIILDEFHNLSFFDLKNPFAIFGKKIMVQKDTMYVVTSSQVSSIKKILKERLDLLFGNFEIIEVKGFDYEISKTFLEKRLEGIRIPDELKDFLIVFTDGRPFYLDAIGAELNNIAAQLQFKWLGAGLISQALENLLFDAKGAINQYFQNLISIFSQGQYMNEYLDILTLVSEGHKKSCQIRSGFNGRKKELPTRIEKLLEENLFTKNGAIYYFDDKVFEFWLRYVYNRKRYSLVGNFQERADLFKREVEDLVSNFIAENKKDAASRIKELLAAFNNDVKWAVSWTRTAGLLFMQATPRKNSGLFNSARKALTKSE
jgi:AAA+ ATPase superfamily predicted ATPase